MRQAEAEARRLGASSGDVVEGASTLSREGAGAFARREYAVATETFLAARDGFARAGRTAAAAAEARRAAARPPAPPPTSEARPPVKAAAAPAPALEAAQPDNPAPPSTAAASNPATSVEAAPSRLTTTRPAPPVSPPVAAPAPPPAARPEPATGPSDEQLIHALVEDYGRAIETKDLGLFRRVKPNLSGDEEQRLRQAFQAGKHDVNIEILDLSVSGNTARVRLVRRDGMNGNTLKPFEQVLSLRRQSAGWAVESIGR
jgi:hypothetical protein